MKNKKLISFLLFLMLNNSFYSQNHISDSLEYYCGRGEDKKAIKFGELQNDLMKDNISFDHIDLLFNLYKIYYNTKDYANSEKSIINAISICEKTKNINNNYYSKLLYSAGFYYFSTEPFNFESSEKYFLKLINLNDLNEYRNKTFNYLGLLYLYKTDFVNAELMLLEALKAKKANKDEDEYCSLYFLNLLYSATGEILKNEKVLVDLSDTANEVYGKNSNEYMDGNYFLANLYLTKLNRLIDCTAIVKNGIEFYESIKDTNNFRFGKYLMLSAGINSKNKNYDLSTKLYLKTITIFENNHINEESNNDFTYYISCINNLGLNYLESGNYKEADYYLLKAHNFILSIINSNKLNKSDELIKFYIPFYLLNTSNLSRLYYELGRYEAGKNICLEALTLSKGVEFDLDINKQQILESLGLNYIELGKYSEAKNVLEEGLKISKIINKKESYENICALNNLAICYENLGEESNSEKVYLEILNLSFEPRIVMNLANLYFKTKNYKKAELFYNKAMKISKDINNNAFKRNLFVNLFCYYRNINDTKKEKNILLKHSKTFQNQILDYLNFSTNNEINEIFSNLIREKALSLSFNNDFKNKFPKINISSYENDLLLKNLILRNQKIIQKAIFISNDSILINKYKLFESKKRELNKINELYINEKPSNYKEITEETDKLEKEIIRSSSVYTKTNHHLLPNWKEIKNSLKPNEISLDLVTFNYFDKTVETNNILYAVYLVRNESKYPIYIPLFEEKQLKSLLSSNDETNKKDNIDKTYLNKSISDLFIKPLEKELDGITTIYLSPSGLGHQIDFAALSINDTQSLGEKYKLHILSSSSELMDYDVSIIDKKSEIELFLYGGIDYDKSNLNLIKSINDNSISSNEDFINSAKRSGIEYLTGTLKEVIAINENANKYGFNSKIISESEATEESFKALDGRKEPYVLHLATHGFFFPDPILDQPKENSSLEGKSKIYKASDDPMMRSGLLLAGAKNYWGKSNQNNTIEDGILTASEISNLDLSACQLVVLSACETGLGEVKGSEGVFGLQRAFKMAGVKNIIMSLWKVPDAQTAELFDIFYSECFAGKSIHEAFRSAQAKMKAKYSPYFWAGFVLLE